VLDLSEAYANTQHNLADLSLGLSDEELGRFVPASPAWTVKDVVGHVTGVAGDVAGGTIPPELDLVLSLNDQVQAERRDELTAEHVEARKQVDLEHILAEWTRHLEVLLPMIRGERPFPQPRPALDAVLVTDLAVHAQDVRSAVGQPGDRDSPGVSVALVSYCVATSFRLAARGLPALRLRYGEKERLVGDGAPGATVSGDRFELFRAFAGRRSRDQILAMEWEGDPAPYVDLIPAYGPRFDAILE